MRAGYQRSVRRAHAHSSGAKRRYSRREAAAGRVVPRVHRGMVDSERNVWVTRFARGEMQRYTDRASIARGGWANVTRIP